MRYDSRWAVAASLLAFSGVMLHPVRAAEEDRFRPLFNGANLDGWEGDLKFWSVKDGAITGQTTRANPTKQNTFLIWRGGTLEDFQLRFSYRIQADNNTGFGNSGVQYRSQDHGSWVVGGYQADIDASGRFTGILYEERGRGILAERGQRVVIDAAGKVMKEDGLLGDAGELASAIRPDAWNDYVIVAHGNSLTHVINGRVMVHVQDDQQGKRARSGVLALQLHAGDPMTIQFKDLRVRRLKAEGERRIVLIAGGASHGSGDHEHRAGLLLFQKCLNDWPKIQTTFYQGWPKDPTAFDEADAIVIYADGGAGHPMIQGDRLDTLRPLMERGVGLACLHYAVEVPKDRGGQELLSWIGGYFETHWSVNPHWEADFREIPDHEVTGGVKPFKLADEWYYHMRFAEDMKGVTPLLSAVPPESTRNRPDGPHSGNAHVRARKGMAEHVAWVYERPGGGRGFGFTGGHFHKEWGNDNMRKLVLNALLWVAQARVPQNGVDCGLSEGDLQANLDPKAK
jgi:type 1 glutamine amidotransferase